MTQQNKTARKLGSRGRFQNNYQANFSDKPCYCKATGSCITCARWKRLMRTNAERRAGFLMGGNHG